MTWGQIAIGVISPIRHSFYFGAYIKISKCCRLVVDTDLKRGDQMPLGKSNRKLVGLPTLAPELEEKG